MKAIFRLIDKVWVLQTQDGKLHDPYEFGVSTEEAYEGQMIDVSEYYQ